MAKRKKKAPAPFVFRPFGSPIELMLREALVKRAESSGSDDIVLWDHSTSFEVVTASLIETESRSWVEVCPDSPEVDERLGKYGNGTYSISLYGAVRASSYKLDFLVKSPNDAWLAIECDGHEWHERTKQQASADRARDRDLLRMGIYTIRFTGSDIHRDADACAREVFQLVMKLDDSAPYKVGYDASTTGIDHGYKKALDDLKRHHLILTGEEHW